MKVSIDNYEVEVTAKNVVFNHGEDSEQDTLAFLCYLACVFYDAANHQRSEGFEYTARSYERIGMKLSRLLSDNNYDPTK